MTRVHPLIMGVWQPSLISAVQFINEHTLGDQVVQLVPDKPSGYWVMLRVTADQRDTLISIANSAKQRWAII